MILVKKLATFVVCRHAIKRTKMFVCMPTFGYSNKKMSIDEQLHAIADRENNTSINEDFTEIANNYIQLEEQSFSQYVKENKYDPQMLLMFLSTFQNKQKVAEYLPLLYPYINTFQPKQLLLLVEHILAFRPTSKPKIPIPKYLQGVESILAILNQLYPADSLIQWIKLIPLYGGKQYYLLCMGYFSILQKMTPQLKTRNGSLLLKCHQNIISALTDQEQKLEVKAGIVALAFQLNYGQAVLLLLQANLDYSNIQFYKNCLLFINISKYLHKKKQSQQDAKQIENQKIEKMLKKQINQMGDQILQFQFQKFMKIDLLVGLWQVIYNQKQLKSIYLVLADKLTSLISNKNYLASLNQLSTNQLLFIFETLEKHKINNPKAIKSLLVLLSTQLSTMEKCYILRLLKCLVTYVRQCQDYLINVRQVIEERKKEFNVKQELKINQILRRVQVLFPKKFNIK